MHTWIHSLLQALVVFTLLPLAAMTGLVGSDVRAEGPHLTPEQAIAVAMSSMEVGANDFRLSDMGQDNTYDAAGPAVAYNSADNEYLVVWYGDDDVGSLVDGEYEVFAQRVDAATGTEIGPDIRLSDMGPDGNPAYDAESPAVAYNSIANQYLVVWCGDDNSGALVDGEYEIYGQRVEGDTGLEIGPDLRLSNMGFDGSPNYDALVPAVAYNSARNEYLVVWYATDNTPPLVVQEYEIYGQRVDGATGAEVGPDDFRLSDMGPDGNPNYDAFLPAVAYNSAQKEYLVVWYGDDDTAPLVDEEFEVFGQRVNAETGAEVGANDFRLSDMGPDGDPAYDGGYPAVAYNSADGQYLVVWVGDDNAAPLVDEEFEVFGQRVNAETGAEVGANDFRLSDMGPNGNSTYGAQDPSVVYNSADDEYLVVWIGDDKQAPLVNDEFEAFGQRVNAETGAEVGANDFRLSDMGPNGDPAYDVIALAAAYNSADDQYLVVWQGDDDTPPLVDDEYEIHGQRVDGATGAELGADTRLSNAGPDGDPAYGVWWSPAVAYNSVQKEYLVVWCGDNNAGLLVDQEFEVYGQRVDAASGAEIGPDIRLSDMGPDGDLHYAAVSPAVAYNSAQNEYLVVWLGDDNIPPLVEGELEVFGQRVDGASGAQIGLNDFRLSDMGPDGDPDYGAAEVGLAVAYNSVEDEYLVVWNADDNTGALVDGEGEIFGQRVDGATGAEVGANDFRLSDMGPDGDPGYVAWLPALAYNSADNEYLVVWQGDDNTGALVDDEYEVYGQRVEGNTGAEIGPDLRLSDMGPDGDPDYDGVYPAVAYNSAQSEYLVVWYGDENTPPLVDNESEVFGQRVDGATGAEIGPNDFRLSDMGPDGDTDYGAGFLAVGYNSAEDEYLVVWQGDDDIPPLVDGEGEIFGQRVEGATGAEVGPNDFRLSDMGPDGDPAYGALFPAVAYNSAQGEYLVVWRGDDDAVPLVDDEFEVFGQRLRSGGYCIYLPLVLRADG
jgi:hypothetical protein